MLYLSSFSKNLIHFIFHFFAASIFLILASVSISKANGFNYLTTVEGLKSSIIRSVTKGKNGFIWIGTFKGLYRYDGYDLVQQKMPNGLPFNEVRSLFSDSKGVVWIATKNDGLFLYENGIIQKFIPLAEDEAQNLHFMFSANDLIYLVFKQVIVEVQDRKIIAHYKLSINEEIYSAITFSENELMLGGEKNVFIFDKLKRTIKKAQVKSKVENRRKLSIHQDIKKNIWLGRSDGLYIYDKSCMCFLLKESVLNKIEIYTFESNADYLWIGTNKNGLYEFNLKNETFKHYKYDKTNSFGINDVSVISIDYTTDNQLLVGTFNNGLNFITLDQLSFGAVPGVGFPADCLNNLVVYDVFEESASRVWIGTDLGLTFLDLKSNECIHFNSGQEDGNAISGQKVYSLTQKGNDLFATGSKGVDVIDLSEQKVTEFSDLIPKISTFFIYEMSEDSYFLGTSKGLYLFDSKVQQLTLFKSTNGDELSHLFFHYLITPDGVYFGSDKGIYKLEDSVLAYMPIFTPKGEEIHNISGMSYQADVGLLVASDQKHFLQVVSGEETYDLSHLFGEKNFDVSIFEILMDSKGLYWMSSDRGIFRFDLNGKKVNNFLSSDGLQGNDFIMISSHIGKSGKFYFGGRNGFNAFYPEDIKINETPPKVVLTEISQLNKNIGLGETTRGGFLLEKPVEQLDYLELGHRDLAIGFEFAALDYADSSRNQYAHRLLGFDDEWQYVSADNRKVNYTNLSPGFYTFEIKAANKDGVWNPEPRQLTIKVYPAPWLSPWAYVAYVLIILASIWGFIRYKTIASRKRAKELEVQVAERTQEVVMQKQMVESLLDHKNEVFANVTHEFKTPLSLIVGPADQLAEQPELDAHQDKVTMIKRNAQRLLLMVGQILKLSQAEQEKAVIREVQAVQSTCLMLYESFAPLAKDKGINLSIQNDHDVNVYATHECLEMVIGNLMSNAIKYTPSGGRVELSTCLVNGQVQISVKDSGPGISDQDKDRVFNRFVRLDGHQGIQGTGIGLAVVKEVTAANKGFVQVSDNPNGGSVFVVSLPVTDLELDGSLSEVMTEQLVSNTRIEMATLEPVIQPVSDDVEQKPTVLIIEDNPDMQQHTLNVLQERYRCLLASNGEEGIGFALKEVPDIIICDVMMPGMDGYQVTRMLRNDARSSHIPIILLTALNTRESRIKGWREKIDRYVTKPFDAHELHAQLENILSVRQLLQNQTVEAIEAKDDLHSLDLTKQDIKFLDQLKAVIAEVFDNEYIQKADLADRMAVSERQLQRKVKALIGQGPLDLLRDYRLTVGKEKLREGLQVSLVSDECGFSSVSYFGTCFKKKYDMTPKQYQQQIRTKPGN